MSDPRDDLDQDTAATMRVLLMLAGADALEPGTALVLLSEVDSPLTGIDAAIVRGAVEAINAVAAMGDVTPEQLAEFAAYLDNPYPYDQAEA